MVILGLLGDIAAVLIMFSPCFLALALCVDSWLRWRNGRRA